MVVSVGGYGMEVFRVLDGRFLWCFLLEMGLYVEICGWWRCVLVVRGVDVVTLGGFWGGDVDVGELGFYVYLV